MFLDIVAEQAGQVFRATGTVIGNKTAKLSKVVDYYQDCVKAITLQEVGNKIY